MRSLILAIISLLALLAPHGASGQITQTSQNWKGEEWKRYWAQKEYMDTVLIVFDTEQELVTVEETRMKTEDMIIDNVAFEKNYPPPADGCVKLVFKHRRDLPIGNEEYLIDKAGLSEGIAILYDNVGTAYRFWFERDAELFEKTLILVEAREWKRKKKDIKGWGVLIYVHSSCDDLVDTEEERREAEERRKEEKPSGGKEN